MITNKKQFSIELAKGLLKLTIAGVAIGLFKEYDLLLAIGIVIKLTPNIYNYFIKPPKSEKKWVLLYGMILMGVLALLGEYWFVKNGYWTYHNIDTTIPLWLPFAWMYAFCFLYRLEEKLIPLLKVQNSKNKFFLALFLACILPAYGEVWPINLGVWTYHWPYQFLGVPFNALLLLLFAHMGLYVVLFTINSKFKLKDFVYS